MLRNPINSLVPALRFYPHYAPALDVHGDTLATVIEDSPFSYSNGREVKNWWGSNYKGNMTIRECIEQSANVCTVKKFTEITPALGFKYLTENFNLTTLDSKSDIVQAACLVVSQKVFIISR